MVHTNCQFRDKHTVGGIVFYKNAFLVLFVLMLTAMAMSGSCFHVVELVPKIRMS